MPAIARGADDLLIDGVVSKINTWRAAQVLLDSSVNFTIDRDQLDTMQWATIGVPVVTIESESDVPADRQSAAHGAAAFTLRLKAVCIVPSLADAETARKRFYYLKEQVRAAIYDLNGIDFGQAVGLIGKIGLPSWSRIAFDDTELDATILVGAWTFDLTYAWDPADIAGSALTKIQVNTAKWSAAYLFGD